MKVSEEVSQLFWRWNESALSSLICMLFSQELKQNPKLNLSLLACVSSAQGNDQDFHPVDLDQGEGTWSRMSRTIAE